MFVFNPHEKSRYIYHKPELLELLELCSHMFANYGTMGDHLVTITMKCVTGTEMQQMMRLFATKPLRAFCYHNACRSNPSCSRYEFPGFAGDILFCWWSFNSLTVFSSAFLMFYILHVFTYISLVLKVHSCRLKHVKSNFSLVFVGVTWYVFSFDTHTHAWYYVVAKLRKICFDKSTANESHW
jgi:hypothetical protein